MHVQPWLSVQQKGKILKLISLDIIYKCLTGLWTQAIQSIDNQLITNIKNLQLTDFQSLLLFIFKVQ